MYVGDVAKANIVAMKSNVQSGFFNIGTNSSITILELANIIIKESKLSLNPIHASALKGDIKESQANNSLAKKLLNWEPSVSLRDWLKIAISSRLT